MSSIWYYTPDEFQDCGIIGEHPMEITARIKSEDIFGEIRLGARIEKVVIRITFGEKTTELDITRKFLKSEYTLERWEEDVLNNYKSVLENRGDDRNEEVGA